MKETKIRIEFSWLVWQKCLYIMRLSLNDEWSILANSTYDKETGVIKIIDSFIPEQTNFTGTTEMTDNGAAKAVFELSKKNGTQNVWIHSHVAGGVFWSPTDKQTMRELAENGHIISVVMNNKGETKGCIYQCEPVPLMQDDIPVSVGGPPITVEKLKGWEEEFYNAILNPRINTPYTYFDPPVVAEPEVKNPSHEAYENQKWYQDWQQNLCSWGGYHYFEGKKKKMGGKFGTVSPIKSSFVSGEANLWAEGTPFQLQELLDMSWFREFMGTKEISRGIQNIKNGSVWTKGFNAKRINKLTDLFQEVEDEINGRTKESTPNQTA